MEYTDTYAVGASIRAKTVIYSAAFLIPALFSAPQWVTGTVVNALLFLAAARLPEKDLIPVSVLPSLGAVTHGVLFGPQTIFLYYFLPFIWIGNYTLIKIFCSLNKTSLPLSITLSSIGKYIVLSAASFIYVRFGIAPPLFATAMGMLQLITAIAGGVFFYGYMHYLQRHERI